MAYQAAAEGLGVMVGLLAFVRDDLASGRLVAPFDLRVPTQGGYFMAWRADRPVPQRVKDFESWIAGEAASARLERRLRGPARCVRYDVMPGAFMS
jgi:LysR family glycine cleavage system transcriptional activator